MSSKRKPARALRALGFTITGIPGSGPPGDEVGDDGIILQE
jgi:hypothetical protein